MITCRFLFYQGLNDFLPSRLKGNWISLSLPATSSVKDAVEAIGVPHVEISRLLVNGEEKPFRYLLEHNDDVEVVPHETVSLPSGKPSFVLDVHLGKLARLLRMLGIDCFYEKHLSDKEIVAITTTENRAVLTRDVGLLKHKVLQHGYWLRSQQPDEQLLEVMKRFSLCGHLQPFSRCIACNGPLCEVEKAAVLERLPSQTRQTFNEFYKCQHCRHVYWKGSHFEKMEKRIERIRSLACQ